VKRVFIPRNLIEIESGCFSNPLVPFLAFESHPQLRNFANDAFAFCAHRRTVVIPNSLKSPGIRVFEMCRAVQLATFDDALQLSELPVKLFLPSQIQSIAIPPCIAGIGHRCFARSRLHFIGSEQLSTLKLVRQKAFECCNALNAICIPAMVRVIERTAFFCSLLLRFFYHV
jgi:hypothetical protein